MILSQMSIKLNIHRIRKYSNIIMKTLTHQLLLIFLFTGFSLTVNAQQNNGQISGRVFDPQNQPAEFSTVILLNRDSVFLGGTLTKADGSFLIDKVKPGDYFVMVRNLEFENYVSGPIKMVQDQKIVLKDISLKTAITGLAEVVIRGEKAVVEVRPDKIVYNISSSTDASGNNALEMLGKAPGVVVDMDKNIILQGKSGTQVFINGRPSRLSGSDLANMLEGMRSDNIGSVEIISNPSAKYEAEGTGGIINIVLKKNINAGFNGNVTGSYSKGNFERKSAGTSLNYNNEKINFYSGINLSDDTFQTDFVQTTERSDYLLDFVSNSRNNRKGINLSAGMDYTINEAQTITFDAKALVNDRVNTLESNTRINDLNAILPTEILRAKTLDDMPSENYNLNLQYSLIPDRISSFTVDLSAGRYTSNKNTRQPNDYYDAGDSILLRSVNSEYLAKTSIDLLSAKVDYERKFNKTTLSTGAKYSYISTDNNLDFYNIENGSPVKDINRSNNFTYLEKIAAAYFILNYTPNEKISMNAGLRMENTSSLGTLDSQVPVNDKVVPRNYTSLFPNLSLSYDDKKKNVISLSYGRRITRPNYQDLNPFESKLSELSAWRGNPFLKPNYISNYQLTWSFNRKLVVSNTFSVTHDFFATIFQTVDEKSNVLIPYNMQKVINNGLSVSYPLKVSKWWEISSFLIYNYEKYDGNLEGTIIDLKADIANIRIQNKIKLPADILMELTYNYSTPWIWRGSVKVDSYHKLDFGIKKSFFKEMLQTSLTISDIFNTASDYHYKSNYGGQIINGVISFDNRRIGISATYKFGNQKLKTGKKSKSAMDDELKRIGE